MNDSPSCILCKNCTTTLIQQGVRYAPKVEVHRCVDCGLVFLWPRPTQENLNKYYADDTYRDDYADSPVHQRYREDIDEARIRTRRLRPFLSRYTRLLEVGSGSGAFLDAVRPYVADVVGVEPDNASRAWISEHLQIQIMTRVDDVRAVSKNFDLVVLFHVLEHILDPVSFLEKVGQCLGPDGKLLVEVPNVDDALVSLYQIPAYLTFYYQKAHLYYFSSDTLKSILNLAGFKAKVNGIQRYDLSNHMRWMLAGKPGGQSYYSDILSPSAYVAYSDSLIQAGHSDTLWAIAERNL